jgi:hypothetical protein
MPGHPLNIDHSLEKGGMRYDAYYAVHPSFLADKALSRRDVLDSPWFAFVLSLDADDAEEAWTLMQGEIWSPRGQARELISGLGLGHTSMSVSDCLLDNVTGDLLQCDICGFRPVPDQLECGARPGPGSSPSGLVPG